MSEINDIIQEEQENLGEIQMRRKKLEELKESGENPFNLTSFEVTGYAKNIKDDFENLEGETFAIAGRVMSMRDMGKASFLDIRDHTDRMQVYAKIDDIGEDSYKKLKRCDVGDIMGIEGEAFKTRRGEISIHARKVTLLSKALLPLPEKFHGLKDTDTRYRQRYVDLIVNPDVKDTFLKRSQILKEIRKYLDNLGYIEVDTPVLHTVSIGAAAKPFKTHHNTLDLEMFLRIETELYLKRLIVGGFDRVYEVGRIFRNEGMSVKHNPEFTSVEMYQAFTDYFGMMDLIEDMYSKLTKTVCGSEQIVYQGKDINMAAPWERLTMVESVKKYSGEDYNNWKTDEEARKAAKAKGIEISGKETKGDILIAMFEEFVEDKLISPTIIYDYPVENSPLAKRKPTDPAFTERFEFFIYGREMGNAFSELNDPIDQRERFEKQVADKIALGEKAEVDDDFITALEYGMPPTGGLGFGLDRLVMLLTDSASIRDVLLFPTMKPKAE